MNDLPTGRAKLHWLIDLYLSGHHDVGTFCREFERAYNFEVKKLELSPEEQAAFSELLKKVVMFSPFEAERKTIPIYVGPRDIKAATTLAKRSLGSV